MLLRIVAAGESLAAGPRLRLGPDLQGKPSEQVYTGVAACRCEGVEGEGVEGEGVEGEGVEGEGVEGEGVEGEGVVRGHTLSGATHTLHSHSSPVTCSGYIGTRWGRPLLTALCGVELWPKVRSGECSLKWKGRGGGGGWGWGGGCTCGASVSGNTCSQMLQKYNVTRSAAHALL
jgi:hypothetical protein